MESKISNHLDSAGSTVWNASQTDRIRQHQWAETPPVEGNRRLAGPGGPATTVAIVAALQELLRQAKLGELQLEIVMGLGLAAVLQHDEIRFAFVVELPDTNHGLSPREAQIARMVADGATNRSVAAALDISLWTVSTHLRRIFAKLAVGSRAEMVAHLFGRPHLPPDG